MKHERSWEVKMFFGQEFINAALDTAAVHTNEHGTKEKRVLVGTVFCGIDKYGTYLSIDKDTGEIYAVRPVLD